MMNNTLVCFGDSQIANNRDEDYPGAKSNNVSLGFMGWTNQRLNQAFNWVANIGHPGYKIDNFSPYLYRAFEHNPGWIMCDGGANNFGAGESADDVKPKVLAVIDAILARGINCIWLLLPPSSSGSTAQTNANHEHNGWVKSLADTPGRAGLFIVDIAQGLADANGNIASAYSNDGTHLNAAGGYRAGQLIYNVIQGFVPRVNRLPIGNPTYELANITPNPLMAGTSGTLTGAGISGVVPTGWTVEDLGTGAVAVCSIPTSASISASDLDPCPWLQVACSNAGTAGIRISATDTAMTKWGPEDRSTYHGLGQIQVDAGITGSFIQGLLRIQNSGGSGILKAYDLFISNTPVWPGESAAQPMRDWVFKSWDITVPAGGAKMQVGVDMNAVGTLRLRRCVARRTRTGD